MSDFLSEHEEEIMRIAGQTELEGMELTLDESRKVEFSYISSVIYDLEESVEKTIKTALNDSLGYIIPLYNDDKALKGYIVVLQGEPIEYYSEVMPLPDVDVASEYEEMYFNTSNTVEIINKLNDTNFKKYQILRVDDNYLLYLTEGNQNYISPLDSKLYTLEKYSRYPATDYFKGMENLKIDVQNNYYQIGGGINIIGYESKSGDISTAEKGYNIVPFALLISILSGVTLVLLNKSSKKRKIV